MEDAALTIFPPNPTHGQLIEVSKGFVYQYDAGINSWVSVVSNNAILTAATPINKGAMSAADLQKLNRLVIPPPKSTIIGTDCLGAFTRGSINLYSGDQFIDVTGTVAIQNINEVGDRIRQDVNYQISQHTYGFDFTLDMQELVDELARRGQLDVSGQAGSQGAKGERGDRGIDRILAGPQGDQGTQGSAPAYPYRNASETFANTIRSDSRKVITNAAVIPDPDDPTVYDIEFEQKTLGSPEAIGIAFTVQPETSSWLLATLDAGPSAQTLFYFDVEPMLDIIHEKFLSELQRLKTGYEDIVRYWLQVMSELYDDQKAALCCALEFCLSGTKSTQLRQHMEGLAATVAGRAKIQLQGRNSASSVAVSSTRLLRTIDSPDHTHGGGPDMCNSGPPFPQPPSDPTTAAVLAATQIAKQTVASQSITIDPLLNSTLPSAVTIDLPAGNYVAYIKSLTAQIDGLHYGRVRIQYLDTTTKVSQFLDKGDFASLIDAQRAYHGLSLQFKHDGGQVKVWLPLLRPRVVAGAIELVIESAVLKSDDRSLFDHWAGLTCELATSHVSWYERGWVYGKGCGGVVEISGQDYIIIKRSLGDDQSCGGGETLVTDCLQRFYTRELGTPALAIPTFDGSTFALPSAQKLLFQFDKKFNDLVLTKLSKHEYKNAHSAIPLAQLIKVVLLPLA